MTEAQAITLVGGLFGLIYAAIQIGDRLWKPGGKASDQQSVRCDLQHGQLLQTVERLTEGQTALLRAVESLVRTIEVSEQLSRTRHEEVMRTIDRNKHN